MNATMVWDIHMEKKGEIFPLEPALSVWSTHIPPCGINVRIKNPTISCKIIEELKQNSGKMYDPRVVEAFLKVIQSEESKTTPSER